MTTTGTNIETVGDEIYGVIMAMIAKEKKLQQAKANRATEETPSPRGVADIDVSFEQDQRNADIEHRAQTFLREVLTRTLTIMEHSRRMTILPRDVSYALKSFDKIHGEVDDVKANKEVEDEDEDEDWDPEIQDETDDDELEDEEEIDVEDEEGDEEAKEEETAGFSTFPVPIDRFPIKEFKECLLWPQMHLLRCEVPMTNEAVEIMSESMYHFLIQKFS